MEQPTSAESKPAQKPPIAFWKAIVLVIIFVFGIVALFGLFIYIFINGAEQMGLSTTGQIAIFVVVTGIFAWLVKRLSDVFSDMSRHWFTEEADDDN